MNALLSFFCLNNDNKHAVNFLHHRTMYMNSHALHGAIKIMNNYIFKFEIKMFTNISIKYVKQSQI